MVPPCRARDMKAMKTQRTQKGVTLLEVLVAVFVLSVGLLGHSKIQALGVRASTDAHLRTQATYLLSEMMERLRANRPAADSNYYATIDYASIDCSAAPAKVCSEGMAGSAVECMPTRLRTRMQYTGFVMCSAACPTEMSSSGVRLRLFHPGQLGRARRRRQYTEQECFSGIYTLGHGYAGKRIHAD